MSSEKNSRSLKVIQDWNSREYKNEGQKAASLQCLINSALDEQDKITRHRCAEAVNRLALDHKTILASHNAVMNATAA